MDEKTSANLPKEIKDKIMGKVANLDLRSYTLFGMTNKDYLQKAVSHLKRRLFLVADWNCNFLCYDNEIFASGENDSGQLGLGDNDSRSQFTPVDLTEIGQVKQIEVGLANTFLVTEQGELFACGDNSFSRLGLGDNKERNRFTRVDLTDMGQAQHIVMGDYHTFLQTDRGLFACGDNYCGQLGLGDIGDNEQRNRFTQVDLTGMGQVRQIIIGDSYTFLLTNCGLFACGSNLSGQLGLGDKEEVNRFTPVDLTEIGQVQQIVTGDCHTFLLTKEGKLFASGNNEDGQLGLGDNEGRKRFTPIDLTEIGQVRQIKAGINDSFLVTEQGKLFTCGANRESRLGLGDDKSRNRFILVDLLKKGQVQQIEIGYNCTFLLTEQGAAFACGGYHDLDGAGLFHDGPRNQFTPVDSAEVGHVWKIKTNGSDIFLLTDRGVFTPRSISPYQLPLAGLNEPKFKAVEELPAKIKHIYALSRSMENIAKKQAAKQLEAEVTDLPQVCAPR